jgi:hypothetical protein
MSDDDLKAVYAWLRAVPPVHNAVPLDDKNDLCQMCSGGACRAPAPGSPCVATAH